MLTQANGAKLGVDGEIKDKAAVSSTCMGSSWFHANVATLASLRGKTTKC